MIVLNTSSEVLQAEAMMLIGGGKYKGESVASERMHVVAGQVYITGVEGMRACCRAHPEAAMAAGRAYEKRPDKAYCLFCQCLVAIDGHAGRCGAANGSARAMANEHHSVDRAFLGDARHKDHMRRYMLAVMGTHAGEDQLTSNAHMRMYLSTKELSEYATRAQLSPGNSDWTWGTVFENFYWSDMAFREKYWGLFDGQYAGVSEPERLVAWRRVLDKKGFRCGRYAETEENVTVVGDDVELVGDETPLLGNKLTQKSSVVQRLRQVFCCL